MGVDPKPGDLVHGQVEGWVTPDWRTEPTNVAKLGDDLWTRGERPIKPGDSWFSPKAI